MQLQAFSIRSRIILLISLFSSMLFLYCFVSSRTNNRVKINGELYTEIIKGKDLLADILPPPEYLIESYLLCNRLLFTPDIEAREQTMQKMEQLKKDYYSRQEYWQESLAQGEIKSLITNESKLPADKFFSAEQDFIASIRSGNRELAESILNGELTTQYDSHRAAIDILVEKSTAWAAENEQSANVIIERSSFILIGLAAIVVLAGIIFGFFVAKSIIDPIRAAIKYAAAIARGHLD